MVSAPVEVLYTALPSKAAVFVISALLVTETEEAMYIVPLFELDMLPVIFPVNVTAPHVPPLLLKLMESVPMSNAVAAEVSPSCMEHSAPAALVLIELITF